MARENPNQLRAEIKASPSGAFVQYEIFRKRLIRAYANGFESNNFHDLDARLIKEFNKKCDNLGYTGLLITPHGAGYTYSGLNTSAVPTTYPFPQDNQVLNPDFHGTGEFELPGNYAKVIENNNGEDFDLTSSINRQWTGDWYFHSPMFLNSSDDPENYEGVDFVSIIYSHFNSTESYNLVDSGQLLGYGDDARQDRVLKIFGIGQTIIDFNKNFSRFTTPITQIVNTLESLPASGVYTTGAWAKYEYSHYQEVPSSATGCVFGCYVNSPSNDKLRDLNMGGVRLHMLDSDGTSRTDVLQIKGSDFHQNPQFFNSVYTGAPLTSGRYHFGTSCGPVRTQVNPVTQQFDEFRKRLQLLENEKTLVRVQNTKLASQIEDWTLISGELIFPPDYSSGSGQILAEDDFEGGTSNTNLYTEVADATSSEATRFYHATSGNPNGAMIISGRNPSSEAGKAYIFERTYATNTAVTTGDITITFDIKAIEPISDSAVHILSNTPEPGRHKFDIQNQIGEGFTRITHTITGIDPTRAGGNGVQIGFQLSAGAVENAGAVLAIDNLYISQGTGTFALEPDRKLTLNLFYGENQSYLDGGEGLGGSIHFAKPFIYYNS